MNIEKKLSKASIKEMLIVTLIGMTLVTVLLFIIFAIFQKKDFLETLHKSWMIVIIIPLIQGITQSLTNRKGLLIVNNIDNPENIKIKIDKQLKQLEYIETQRENKISFYGFKTKWKRTLEFFFKGNLKIEYDRNSIIIHGRRLTINQLETELKLDKESKDI